jgi:AraC-like DNA-binding protein
MEHCSPGLFFDNLGHVGTSGQAMQSNTTVIASGNLATSRRTIVGALGQLALLNISRAHALRIFTNAGLPSRALDEPDFPISLDQELIICSGIERLLVGEKSPTRAFFEVRGTMGIEYLGVLGMAMRHAATALEALKVCLTYPQLTWGHSRMVVSRQGQASLFTFSIERPTIRDASSEDIDRLVEYCLVLDLVTSLRNIEDIMDGGLAPLYITLPFAEPYDWSEIADDLPCPVRFSEAEACIAYPSSLEDVVLPGANPLVYRSYVSIAEKLSLMLAEEISVTERVTRWLWAYTPPLRRGEIARQLAMSERSLTRQLKREGTSYATLLAHVQKERAQNFLRNPTFSVTEIAERLGYAEPAAFTRAFTNWTGSSPLKWRKQKT